MQTNQLLGFNLVFPTQIGDEKFLQTYINRLNRDAALFVAIKLNLLTSSGRFRSVAQQKDAQIQALALLCADGYLPGRLLDRITDVHRTQLRRNAEYTYVIGRPAILELIRWLGIWGTNETAASLHKKTPQVQDAFIKALLIAGDFFFSRFNRHLPSREALANAGEEEKERLRLEAQPVLRLMYEYACNMDAQVALGRARLLLQEEFFDQNEQLRGDFASFHNGLTFDHYLLCAAVVMLFGLHQSRYGDTALNTLENAYEVRREYLSPDGELEKLFDDYLRYKSQDANALAAAFAPANGRESFLNLKSIREKPIVQVKEDNYLVIDEKIFIDSLLVGPLFMLMKKDKESNRQLFAQFGMAVQRYVMRLLRKTDETLPANYRNDILEWEPECKNKAAGGRARSLCDILMVKQHRAAFIEAKGLWFNETAIKGDATTFWNEIERLYGISRDDKSRESRKGYAQLSDVIRLLAEDNAEAVGPAEAISNCDHIYPVLVVHDELMLAPNLAHFLALRFCRELKQPALPESGLFEVGRLNIHSLILLSVHDVEFLQGVQLQVSMLELLEQYSRWDPKRASRFADYLHSLNLPLKGPKTDIVHGAALSFLDEVRRRTQSTENQGQFGK